MSKQLKLKFKKLLKKADFIHADLEYHEELVAEATQLFHEEVQEWFSRLPPEEQKKLHSIAAARRPPLPKPKTPEKVTDDDENEGLSADGPMSLVELEKGLAEENENDPQSADKEKELKRLFYQIAGSAHPDKAVARGAGPDEIKRLEKLFRKAASSYKTGNWYSLYSIASELGLDLGVPSDDHLEWVEEDMRSAMGAIAKIAHLIVWAWYTGDPLTKDAALRSYFLQSYDYEYPRA